MKKVLTIIIASLLLSTGIASAARVTGVTISHDEAFTIASIEVEGDVRYTHQTEIAKDGKPFRIIVDIPMSTHEMDGNKFINLPECKVVGIRSSQYAVDPENIVRVVFDMKAETAYRIDADNKSVKIYVYDADAVHFPVWSTLEVVNGEDTSIPLAASVEPAIAESTNTIPSTPESGDPAGIIAAINMALDEDRKLSLESKTTPPIQTLETTSAIVKPEPATAIEKPESVSNPPMTEITVAKPTFLTEEFAPVISSEPTPEQIADSSTQKTAAQILEEINLETALSMGENTIEQSPAVEPEQIGPAFNMPAESTTSTLTADLAIPIAESTATKIEAPVLEPSSVEPAVTEQVSTVPQETIKKSALPTSPIKTEHGKLADGGVETGTIAAPEADDQSTARFRRDPATSRKIKGTLVAEFPTRLVIKYKGKAYRDPFETLINDSKVQNNPMEQRVPNVEGLRLVGILEAYETDNSALFEDKDGYGYILKAGDKVQKGYVLRVDEDKVYFQIFEYGWSRTVALDMEIF